MITYKNDVVIVPPGETMKELIDIHCISQKEFAERMGITEQHACKLLNGKVLLTSDMAHRLSIVLGFDSAFWAGLEQEYRDQLKKANYTSGRKYAYTLLNFLPKVDMIKNGWIAKEEDSRDQEFSLSSFFEVADLINLKPTMLPPVPCKRDGDMLYQDSCLLVFAQKCRKDARSIETEPCTKKKISADIALIRAMMKQSREEFMPKLTNLLAKDGIALVMNKHIGGSFLHGVAFKEGKHYVIGISEKEFERFYPEGSSVPRFWQTLFHELSHILLGHAERYSEDQATDETEVDAYMAENFSFLDSNKF